MKKFLIIQIRPEVDAAESEFAAILREGGLSEGQVTRVHVDREEIKNIEIRDYCAIIVGGSPFDVSTKTNLKSDVQLHIESNFAILFKKVIDLDFPFLGICSGNGLLGDYCGVSISKKYGEAVGSVDITIEKEGKKDPLLEGLPNSFKALVGHKEACDELPEGAVLLASSEKCPIQMFRIKSNVFATQFHPEADAEEFSIRVDAYKEFGYFPADEAIRVKEMLRGLKTPYANKILKRFVSLYRG